MQNTAEGYSPAYTIKAVAIQILSFFSSEKIEQQYGGEVNLQAYNKLRKYGPADTHQCSKCAFGTSAPNDPILRAASTPTDTATQGSASNTSTSVIVGSCTMNITDLPNELLAQVCGHLEDEDLVNFAKSWSKIGGTTGVVTKFNVLRNRELQCFVLKKSFDEAKLGIGIKVFGPGRKKTLEIEFELISLEAFEEHRVRRSVHGLTFAHWLPMPLSARHYNYVKDQVIPSLILLNGSANLGVRAPAEVIYHFMNDVIIKLSQIVPATVDPLDASGGMIFGSVAAPAKSALKHASEKAIESYFQLFHLLLCLASSDKSLVKGANSKLQSFAGNKTSKADCPNLGHLLLAILISDVELSEHTMQTIIREAVIRNVVWMLDSKGANMPDLAYMEPDAVSEHRLAKTFEASKTSYRLLMFFNLFRNTINRGTGDDRKSLVQMRDELFDSHGAPPYGTAAKLAAEVKAVHEINDFFAFLNVMGIEKTPSRKEMTSMLRKCVEDSMSRGYSVWGVSQARAKGIRESGGVSKGFSVGSFFPNTRRR